MTNNKKLPKHFNETYVNQIHVLKAMVEKETAGSRRQLDINEIAEKSGLKDEKETQRYLYILEGHKLVAPVPAGDFTSKTWLITEDGVKAFKTLSSELGL